MSSTGFAESMSQSITRVFTNIVEQAQILIWNGIELNAKLWLWMPLWLELVLLTISLYVLFRLARHAWRTRSFWTEVIQGKF